ncbi:MAG: N-acetylmuramic acid 6-phosphate etherase [Candidatus Dormiibacterota bacterium]
MTDDVIRVVSPTEERNPRTADIDTLPVLALLERINDEDATVPAAVRAALPELARLVDAALLRLRPGGRVHYFGAGSSGRLGLLDAAELPPTFGVPPDLFVAHLAGGDGAVRRAQEGSEDDEQRGAFEARGVVPEDLVLGIAASGYTPYVGGALRQARTLGAHTALLTSNPVAPLAEAADTVICVDTGPEVVTGSTRMKSATAQKLVLNAFSTAVMVRTGRTWSNLMVAVQPSNAKLRGRLLTLLAQATGLDPSACEEALRRSDGDAKAALVVLLGGVTPEAARAALGAAGGVVSDALRRLAEGRSPKAADEPSS